MFTIGYEGRDIDHFANRLKDFGVSTLIDVREIPLSRKKGFSKSSLRQFLDEVGVEYLHFGELGSPKFLREKLRIDGDYEYFFKEYGLYVKSQTHAIEELHQIITGKTCCLMCYERMPENCHRSIVAQEIKEQDSNGLAVKHI